MEVRKAFEKVRRFVDWEYKEKRPKSVQALRVKSQTAFTIGALPDYQMKSIGPVIFIVVSDYGDTLTVYFFNKFGDNVGSKKYERTPEFMKELKKSTTLKYHLPKEVKVIYKDSTSVLQKEFSKIHRQINHNLGISHEYPYSLLVDTGLKFTQNRKYGSKRVKNELHIPYDLKEKGYLEMIAIFEWFHSYLMSIISTTEEVKDNAIITELTLLLSAVYLPKHAKNILKLIHTDYKIEMKEQQFNLTQTMKIVLTSLTEILQNQKSELKFLLKRYLGMVQLLKKYEMHLSFIEIMQLFLHSCEVFNFTSDTYALYISKEEDITSYFYFKIFSRSHELAKQLEMEELEYKTFLFSTMFGLTILDSDEMEATHKSLTEIIDNTQSMMNNPLVYAQVGKINNFLSDLLSKYIISQLSINMQSAIEGNVLNIILEIQNPTNYPLHDFTYKLVWRPEKRIMLADSTDISKSRDLHDKLKRNYLFEIQNKGKITISCVISFNDPFFPKKIIKKSVFLDKISID